MTRERETLRSQSQIHWNNVGDHLLCVGLKLDSLSDMRENINNIKQEKQYFYLSSMPCYASQIQYLGIDPWTIYIPI